MVAILFGMKPEKAFIQALSDHIVNHYYPQVISESISTPASINNLKVSLLNPVRGILLDCASGIGSTCITAGLHSKKHGGNLEIYAQEIMPVLCAVLRVRTFIHDIENCFVKAGDTLLNPLFKEGGHLKKFDHAVVHPIFGIAGDSLMNEVKNDRFNRFDVNYLGNSTEWLFALHLIVVLKEQGRGIAAVSTGALYNSTNREIRRMLIQSGCIEPIITLPSKILTYTTIPLNLLVISKAKKRESSILMIQAERLFEKNNSVRITEQLNDDVIKRITEICQGSLSLPGISESVPYEELTRGDCLLLPSRYVNPSNFESEFGPLLLDFQKTETWPQIRDVSRVIYRGLNITQNSSKIGGDEYKVINYSDVQNGELIMDGVKSYRIRNPDKYLVKQDDVLVSCKGPTIKMCVVPENVKNTCLSLNFVGIRLDKSKCSPRYLVHYLRSPVGQAYLINRQVGTSIITLKNSDFAEMPLYLPPLEEQLTMISEYERFERETNNEIKRLNDILRHSKWRLYTLMKLDSVILNKELISNED